LKNSNKYILYLAAFICGILFFLIYKNILVIKFLSFSNQNSFFTGNTVIKKNITFYYWKDEKIYSEKKEFVWLSDKSETLKHFTNEWLSILLQENIIKKRVILNSVALNKEQDVAFMSFDQPIVDLSWSIFDKWNCIESLLKSIKESDFKIKEIVFLVNHKPMKDEHLDFSKAWSILGFY